MGLANEISRAFYSVTIENASPKVIEHVHTLLIDALACMLGGAGSDIAELAGQSVTQNHETKHLATIIPDGPRVSAAEAALVNGTMVRSLDFMDIYVDMDVCHPSESIPAALACAEASGASGQAFLDSVLAACAFHVQLAGNVPLHLNGLHHVGHAAWVVPLVAARLASGDEAHAANTLNLSASGIIVPEGFSRGHVANVKGMAFPLIAKRAIELEALAETGLKAQAGACEEVVKLLGSIMNQNLDESAFVQSPNTDLVSDITLKAYPAQYALQPLIAAGAAFRKSNSEMVPQITAIKVRAAQQTIERTADKAKFRPTSREAADHSLPFCIACGLLDGGLSVETLQAERWKDDDILRIANCIQVEAMGEQSSFTVGRPEITLTFGDGATAELECEYPGVERQWRDIAVEKLKAFKPMDADRIIETIEGLMNEKTVKPLVDALCGKRAAHMRAS